MTRSIDTNTGRQGSRAAALTAVLAIALLAACSMPTVAVAQADSCPNAGLRKGPGALLPDCRAYEQVSPVDKNGGDVLGAVPSFSASANGARVIFSADTEFSGASWGGGLVPSVYLSTRAGGGWKTVAMSPPVTPTAAGTKVALSSVDLGRSLLTTAGVVQTDPPDTSAGDLRAYTRDNVLGVVSPLMSNDTLEQYFNSLVISADASRLAFVSFAQLTDEPMPGDFYAKVYERVAGQTRLASILPDGTTAGFAHLGSGGDISGFEPFSTIGAMSNDGRHIFFNDAVFYGSPKELYRRSDGATTVSASPSKRSSMDPEGVKTKIFKVASTDGSRVFFTSAQHLTDDANTGPSRAGADLYRYDVEADELVDVSATPGGDGARVAGVIGAGEDGRSVYYVALGQVVPAEGVDNSSADPGTERPNLYLWRDDGTPEGSTRFIATLSAADASNWSDVQGGTWTARVTGDGGSLIFQSEAAIPGHDGGGVRQIYHYDSGADQLSCVSCNPRGDTPIGVASTPLHAGFSYTQRWEFTHALSDDGRRVFFNTSDALVARDNNGEIDPYMWSNGQLSLLSTGTDADPSYFHNAGESGDDAFIVTAEALTPHDIDDLYDMYDARVGGGFPAPAAVPSCADDECQGADAGTPPAGDVGSERLRATRDVSPSTRLVLRLRAPTRAQRARLARGGRIGLRVRVSAAARVRVVARASTRRGSRVVASGSASSSKAGLVVVRLGLDRLAQRRLRNAGAMRLSFQARAAGTRSRSLTLRLGANR